MEEFLKSTSLHGWKFLSGKAFVKDGIVNSNNIDKSINNHNNNNNNNNNNNKKADILSFSRVFWIVIVVASLAAAVYVTGNTIQGLKKDKILRF
jgi:hypothetical protein